MDWKMRCIDHEGLMAVLVEEDCICGSELIET